MTDLRSWLGAAPHAIDGGLATELEQSGHDLSDRLWSARLLRDDPAAIVAVHEAYFAAGATIATTASYQASRTGFAELGLSAAVADELIASSVELARAAAASQPADRPAFVAASVGPYGAILAGGEEYVGRYGLSTAQLRDFHRQRIEVLAGAEPDLLAVETIPDLAEVRAIASLLSEFGLPAWISVSCRDDRHTNAGDAVEDVVDAVAAVPEVVAVGVNCTAPEHVTGIVRRMSAAVAATGRTDLGIVAYPNTGRVWDGANSRWTGEGEAEFDEATIGQWMDAGATLIGGCCGTSPATIARIAAALG